MESQDTMQAILITRATVNPNQTLERLALFDESGDPVDTLESVGGGDVVLTGFVPAPVGSPVAATDTVNQAIAKLEALIADLSGRVDTLENPT